MFFFQFVILYFDNDSETDCKPYQRKLNIKIPGCFSKELKLIFSFAYIGYAIMLIAAFFGCVSQFRGYWLLIDIHFIPGKNSFSIFRTQVLPFILTFQSVLKDPCHRFNIFAGNKMICHSICSFYGMFLLFLLYCGTSLHGGIFLERQRHTNGILFPNFFLTYLLATKLESKKTYTINVVGNSSATNISASSNSATNLK